MSTNDLPYENFCNSFGSNILYRKSHFHPLGETVYDDKYKPIS